MVAADAMIGLHPAGCNLCRLMYANWAPSLGGLEAVTGETKVRVEVGCIDQVVWRGRPGGLGGGGGADDNMRKRYSQGRL